MHTSRKTKIIGITAALCFVGSFLALVGHLVLIAKAESALDTKRVQIAENRAYQDEYAQLERLVRESEAEREKIAAFIMKDEDVIDFLALLESLGTEQGVLLTTNSLEVLPLGSAYEELKVQVEIVGPYTAVTHVIALLETLPHQSHVSRVTLAKEGATSTWKASAVIHVTKYKKP